MPTPILCPHCQTPTTQAIKRDGGTPRDDDFFVCFECGGAGRYAQGATLLVKGWREGATAEDVQAVEALQQQIQAQVDVVRGAMEALKLLLPGQSAGVVLDNPGIVHRLCDAVMAAGYTYVMDRVKDLTIVKVTFPEMEN